MAVINNKSCLDITAIDLLVDFRSAKSREISGTWTSIVNVALRRPHLDENIRTSGGEPPQREGDDRGCDLAALVAHDL